MEVNKKSFLFIYDERDALFRVDFLLALALSVNLRHFVSHQRAYAIAFLTIILQPG
jgi:hypothetical protein